MFHFDSSFVELSTILYSFWLIWIVLWLLQIIVSVSDNFFVNIVGHVNSNTPLTKVPVEGNSV